MTFTDKYVLFWGGEFSQWYPSKFTENGLTFKTAEHYMMYHKALTFNDQIIANKILESNIPEIAKELGRKVRNFDPILWDKVKLQIVTQGNYLKFSQNPKLKQLLLSIADRLPVEASPIDRIWGTGLNTKNTVLTPESEWPGQNLLGIAIKQAKEQIAKETNDNKATT